MTTPIRISRQWWRRWHALLLSHSTVDRDSFLNDSHESRWWKTARNSRLMNFQRIFDSIWRWFVILINAEVSRARQRCYRRSGWRLMHESTEERSSGEQSIGHTSLLHVITKCYFQKLLALVGRRQLTCSVYTTSIYNRSICMQLWRHTGKVLR